MQCMYAFVMPADINECTETKESICFANSDCVNIDGSYDCVCRAGYLENGTFCMSMCIDNFSKLNVVLYYCNVKLLYRH